MKKTITACILGLTVITNAHAELSVGKSIHATSVYRIDQNSYRAGYNNGYSHGKSHAYNNVVKTVFIAGTVLIVGTMIYQLGKDSRWTTTENGVTYRF